MNAPQLEITSSRSFGSWLAESKISLAFTTYQTGKLFLIGLQPNGRLSIFERTFNRCMGMWSDGNSLWMSSLFQLWKFQNILQPTQVSNGYDRLYVPQVGYTTGDIDIHDLAVDRDGRVVFVSTLFSCLATLSETDSFTPLWKPPYISKLAAEDRCHLNGLAMQDGRPRFVTAVSRSDVADGWRDHRRDGGVVLDVQSGETLTAGLSMPHSPRVIADEVWLLNSGTGFLGKLSDDGTFEPVTFCPGYARGMGVHGDRLVIGLSRPRNHTFSGLELQDNLESRHAEARCGLLVIDRNSGDIVDWLRIEGVVEELYDVVILPEVRRPMALGFKTDEIHRTISVGPQSDL